MNLLTSIKNFFFSPCYWTIAEEKLLKKWHVNMSSWTLIPKDVEVIVQPAQPIETKPLKELQMNYPVLLSAIISSIKQIETLMPAATGKEKYEAVTILVEGVVGEVGASITPIVESLVAAFHKVGLFIKKVV